MMLPAITVRIGNEDSSVTVEMKNNAVNSYSLDFSGRVMDQAVIAYARNKYGLLIGAKTAEAVRRGIGSAYPLDEPLMMQIRARSVTEGTPRTVFLSDEEIRGALAESVRMFIEDVKSILEKIPKDFAAETAERGILLKGGDELKNLERRLMKENILIDR